MSAPQLCNNALLHDLIAPHCSRCLCCLLLTKFCQFAVTGNINQLILKVESYARSLEGTQGIIAEFVNPKYKDASKTAFKSSTRLECMMQDYPKALPPSAAVGFTLVNQVRLCLPGLFVTQCLSRLQRVHSSYSKKTAYHVMAQDGCLMLCSRCTLSQACMATGIYAHIYIAQTVCSDASVVPLVFCQENSVVALVYFQMAHWPDPQS